MPTGLPDWYSFAKIIHYAQEIAVDSSPFWSARLGRDLLWTALFSGVAYGGGTACTTAKTVPSGETWFIHYFGVHNEMGEKIAGVVIVDTDIVLACGGDPACSTMAPVPIRVGSGRSVKFCVKNWGSVNADIEGFLVGWKEP